MQEGWSTLSSCVLHTSINTRRGCCQEGRQGEPGGQRQAVRTGAWRPPSVFPGQCRPGRDLAPHRDHSTKQEEETMMPALVQGWGCNCGCLPQSHCRDCQKPQLRLQAAPPAVKSTGLPEPTTGTTGCRDISSPAKGGQFSQAWGVNGMS